MDESLENNSQVNVDLLLLNGRISEGLRINHCLDDVLIDVVFFLFLAMAGSLLRR